MAVTSNQLIPGMVISIKNDLYRVESAVKVTVAKGNPFIKVRLRNLTTDDVMEKNFKLDQSVKDVALRENELEFLYLEGKDYLFLDIEELDKVLIAPSVIENRVDYLKEGISVHAKFYGDKIFSIELPQFLELMVVKTEEVDAGPVVSNATKMATLETGAKLEVPLFIEEGDVIKVDTSLEEYIQRI